MLNKINLKFYIPLTLLNFLCYSYLVYEKNIYAISIFALFLLNQTSLYLLIQEIINSANGGLDKFKFGIYVLIKMVTLVGIVLVMKHFQPVMIFAGGSFILQTFIYGISLKQGTKRS